MSSDLPTEFDFRLPRGLVDGRGVVHRDGVMRLAMASDEIDSQGHPRVRHNAAYLSVLLLARTVLRIGDIVDVEAASIERLFASDFAFLQGFYRRVNQTGDADPAMTCPSCRTDLTLELSDLYPAVGRVSPDA